MPQTSILVYRQSNGEVPLVEWLDELEIREPKAHAKCLQRVLALEQLGSELRRPHADSLGDGLYELRAEVGNVHYRMIYFFHGSNVAVLTHGFTKERKVPPAEMARAKARRREVLTDPDAHIAEFEI